jgi:hypothetical protein
MLRYSRCRSERCQGNKAKEELMKGAHLPYREPFSGKIPEEANR